MENLKLDLVIERSDNELSGRIIYNENLIVDVASTVSKLEIQLKALLYEFEDIDPNTVEFNHLFDVYALFEQFDFLNISKVAQHAGINAGLLRQYASGVKYPSANQAKRIEGTIHQLAAQMQKATVYAE